MHAMHRLCHASAIQVLLLLAATTALWGGSAKDAQAALLLYEFSAPATRCVSPLSPGICDIISEITGSFAIDSSDLNAQGSGTAQPLYIGATEGFGGGWYSEVHPPLTFTHFELTMTQTNVLEVSSCCNPEDFFELRPLEGSSSVLLWPNNLLEVDYGPRTVTLSPLTPIPLPAALPFFLSALAGLGFMGWRGRQAA